MAPRKTQQQEAPAEQSDALATVLQGLATGLASITERLDAMEADAADAAVVKAAPAKAAPAKQEDETERHNIFVPSAVAAMVPVPSKVGETVSYTNNKGQTKLWIVTALGGPDGAECPDGTGRRIKPNGASLIRA